MTQMCKRGELWVLGKQKQEGRREEQEGLGECWMTMMETDRNKMPVVVEIESVFGQGARWWSRSAGDHRAGGSTACHG